MIPHAVQLVRQGPLEAYLRPLPFVLELSSIVHALPCRTPVVWLDSARVHPVTGRWSILGWDPWLSVTAEDDAITVSTSRSVSRSTGHPLEALQRLLRRYQGSDSAGEAGKAFGLLGYLSYDCNRWIERVPTRRPPARFPEMQWFGMRMVLTVDHLTGRSGIVSLLDPHRPPVRARREALARLEACDTLLAHQVPFHPVSGPSPECVLEATSSRAAFERMVRGALEHIRAGDIFQANVAQQFTTRWRGNPLALYLALRRINPSPFACWMAWEEAAVVSCSPERLVRVQDGWVDTRPIAGTRPRGQTPQEDATNSFELLMSEKECAEHIMLVDLARNDLGRICRLGSVAVNELMALEDYSHVIHIVSDVGGQLRSGVETVEVIRAVFPGGTITGCPKVRCMEILAELEPVARGLYTGSLGRLGFDGTVDLNIAIRTMTIQRDRLSFHVGAGIVADSQPDREYEETLAKAGALVNALETVGAPAAHSSEV